MKRPSGESESWGGAWGGGGAEGQAGAGEGAGGVGAGAGIQPSRCESLEGASAEELR